MDGVPDTELLRTAWIDPGVFSVLTLIGPDVIQCALAQLTGRRFTPIAFSFGWVAYSFSTLVKAVGANQLMPEPDFDAIVINGKSGYERDNRSWIIGRMLRDYVHWCPHDVKDTMKKVLADVTKEDTEKAKKENRASPPARTKAGLCVTIFRASSTQRAGEPVPDWIYCSGFVLAVVQLLVAAVPIILHREWSIILVTGGGIVLGYLTGALPQWRTEKFGSRRAAKTVVLTAGNGAQHALVIIGDNDSIDLEALSTADPKGSLFTTCATIALCILWIAHLITAISIVSDLWYLMLIGGIGMIHSVMVAGLPRKPEAVGLPLEFVECIAHPKVMRTLENVENKYSRLGASMLEVFFPGKLRPDEQKFWEKAEKKADELDEQKKARAAPAAAGADSGQKVATPQAVEPQSIVAYSSVPPV